MILRADRRLWPDGSRAVLGVACCLAFCALISTSCGEEQDPNWAQFNAEDDTLSIDVGSADLLDAVSVELHSSVTGIVIGEATVDPGGGPLGTLHTVLVVVHDDWEDQVGRATVRTQSDGRGADEYEMELDPADEGYYGLELVSVGAEGEQRSDTLTFRLWYDSEEDGSQDSGG